MHLGFTGGDSFIHRLDPRTRVLAAAVLSVVLAASDRAPALCLGLIASAFLVGLAELAPGALLKRLVAANAFLLLLWIVLPLASGGEVATRLGPLALRRDGLAQALGITLKCNAILLVCMALVATMDAVSLGHALHHLRVPRKLIHILLFTVRYLDVMRLEYYHLRNAMKVRCFRPRVNRRTYRTYGYLVGMLLVNSFDRSERIMDAMKCRGFKGQFYVLRHFAFAGRDAKFAGLVACLVAALGWLQWTTAY